MSMRYSIGYIALRDLAHEWRSTLVTVLAVTVALAPLLLLFGLWFGVVETLRDRLASDPANLRLRDRVAPATALDDAWFETVRQREDVAFVLPRTRYGSLEVTLWHLAKTESHKADRVRLTPTAPGDPVLDYAGLDAPQGEAVVLSHRAAEELQVEAGDRVMARIGRLTDAGESEYVSLPLTVHAVLPSGAGTDKRAYAPLPILQAVEDYREWIRVERYGWPGDPPRPSGHGGFRIYAKSLADVEGLRQWLRAQNLDVESAADRIAATERINAALGALFTAILALTLTGYAATVGLNQVACVTRKRQILAVLRLIGYGPATLGWYPILQGAVIALIGALAALILYHAMEPVIGVLVREIVEVEGRLMRLPIGHAAVAVIGSVALAGVASLVAGRRAMQISPAENLRDA